MLLLLLLPELLLLQLLLLLPPPVILAAGAAAAAAASAAVPADVGATVAAVAPQQNMCYQEGSREGERKAGHGIGRTE